MAHSAAAQGKTLRQISRFIDDAFATGDSVLIHSVDGNSRAACVVIGLFMIRFGWPVGKCFEFVRSRRPEILPRAVYMRQLQTSAKTLGYARGRPQKEREISGD